MLAKIIVRGDTREEAIRRMRSALGELVIEGITTNLDLQYELVGSEWFAQGNAGAISARLEERCKKVC
jgi:acetyl-CoA carboxylase biotin carboxylase subunit